MFNVSRQTTISFGLSCRQWAGAQVGIIWSSCCHLVSSYRSSGRAGQVSLGGHTRGWWGGRGGLGIACPLSSDTWVLRASISAWSFCWSGVDLEEDWECWGVLFWFWGFIFCRLTGWSALRMSFAFISSRCFRITEFLRWLDGSRWMCTLMMCACSTGFRTSLASCSFQEVDGFCR